MFYPSDVEIFETIKGVRLGKAIVDLSDYLNIANYPNWSKEQRYDNRIDKERGKHLRGVFSPSMININIGVINEGSSTLSFLLDGNSRQTAINDGKLLNAPKRFLATVYFCNTREEIDELFYTFDSKNAVDTSKDVQSYVLEALELKFQSQALKANFWAATNAARGKGSTGGSQDFKSMLKVVEEYKEALRLLDIMMLDRNKEGNRVCSAVMLSVLLRMFKEYGGLAYPIVKNFRDRATGFEEIYDVLDGIDENGKALPINDTNKLRRQLHGRWFEIFKGKIK